MKDTHNLPVLLERFFTQRLMAQRRASTHTIGSYRSGRPNECRGECRQRASVAKLDGKQRRGILQRVSRNGCGRGKWDSGGKQYSRDKLP